jgi:CRP/FNR family nitrogen fixation transcriptional regulator
MLVRLKSSPKQDAGPLAALAGDRVTCSDFQYRKLTEIFGEGEPAEHVYQLTSGAVRTYKLLADGRRQINAFHLPGDIFGIENSDVYRFSADAILATTVRVVKQHNLFDGFDPQDVGLTARVLRLVTSNLQHAEDHMLLLGRKTSVEKVATFLLEMDERLGSPTVMALPMNRRDIADYLGLTLETVSRALAKLRKRNLIRVTGSNLRVLVLLDRGALAEVNEPD